MQNSFKSKLDPRAILNFLLLLKFVGVLLSGYKIMFLDIFVYRVCVYIYIYIYIYLFNFFILFIILCRFYIK